MIPMDAGYLRAMREATRRLGILLVFDEVVSLRVAYGGAEEHYGVVPDMTCLGKLIGGGFPLGAFGGREDIMALFDPSRGPPAIPHPGSYNANPVSLAAGLATLELLTRDTIARLNRTGERLRAELGRVFDRGGSAGDDHRARVAVRDPSHPGAGPHDPRCRGAAMRSCGIGSFWGCTTKAMLLDPRGVGTLSTAIGEAGDRGAAGRAAGGVGPVEVLQVGSISRRRCCPPYSNGDSCARSRAPSAGPRPESGSSPASRDSPAPDGTGPRRSVGLDRQIVSVLQLLAALHHRHRPARRSPRPTYSRTRSESIVRWRAGRTPALRRERGRTAAVWSAGGAALPPNRPSASPPAKSSTDAASASTSHEAAARPAQEAARGERRDRRLFQPGRRRRLARKPGERIPLLRGELVV